MRTDHILINQSGREHFAVVPAGFEVISVLLTNELIAELDLLPGSFLEDARDLRRMLVPLI